MFSGTFKYTYKIDLPSATHKEVLEWFEIMENKNKLTEALIELVHSNIKSKVKIEAYNAFNTNQIIHPETAASEVLPQNDFIDSLYNWNDSANAIFKEIREEKKEKKKMLSI